MASRDPIDYKIATDMNGCGRPLNFEGTRTVRYGDNIRTFTSQGTYCVDAATGEKLSFCRDDKRVSADALCPYWRRDSEIAFDG